jgi:hypothetical protein
MKLTFETTLECLPETIAIEGNASAWDEETDKRVEDEIRAQLESGNEWAWCSVTVRVIAYNEQGEPVAQGESHLGAASYASESEFKESKGDFEAMESIAREECEREIARLRAALVE